MKARNEFKTEKEYIVYLRIYFVAMALIGLSGVNNSQSIEDDVRLSVKYADALIEELNHE